MKRVRQHDREGEVHDKQLNVADFFALNSRWSTGPDLRSVILRQTDSVDKGVHEAVVPEGRCWKLNDMCQSVGP